MSWLQSKLLVSVLFLGWLVLNWSIYLPLSAFQETPVFVDTNEMEERVKREQQQLEQWRNLRTSLGLHQRANFKPSVFSKSMIPGKCLVYMTSISKLRKARHRFILVNYHGVTTARWKESSLLLIWSRLAEKLYFYAGIRGVHWISSRLWNREDIPFLTSFRPTDRLIVSSQCIRKC